MCRRRLDRVKAGRHCDCDAARELGSVLLAAELSLRRNASPAECDKRAAATALGNATLGPGFACMTPPSRPS